MRGGNDESFPPGTAFHTVRGGRSGHTDAVLGAGGQGAVYSVEVEGSRFALKWYHPSYASIDTLLRERLSRAIERGPPNDRFLWPIDLVEIENSGSFGYIMPIRDAAYAGIRDLIAAPPRRIELSLTMRATLCMRIAQSFLELHASGFCYQDINFGNIFFHPGTGDILICDNDNVDVDGANASVFGTRKFMAPEVVRREALPSTRTDLFSMAVLFFYVLIGWHPLDGKREAAIQVMDAAAEQVLYGTNPLFMFDPADDSNGPVPGQHEPIIARWNILSPALRNLFVRSFTTGLHHPLSRVLESEWRNAFATMIDSVVPCQACGWEHATQGPVAQRADRTRTCMACGVELTELPTLTIGRSTIVLFPNRRIEARHLRLGGKTDPASIVATVEVHPAKPGILGLRNMSQHVWRVSLPESTAYAVPPGRAVRIMDGASVEFGGSIGTLSVPGVPARTPELQR